MTHNMEKRVPNLSIHHVDWIDEHKNCECKDGYSSYLLECPHRIFTILIYQNISCTWMEYLILHIDELNLVPCF